MVRFDIDVHLSFSGFYSAKLTYTPKVEKDGCGCVTISDTGETRDEAIYKVVENWLGDAKDRIQEDKVLQKIANKVQEHDMFFGSEATVLYLGHNEYDILISSARMAAQRSIRPSDYRYLGCNVVKVEKDTHIGVN